MNYYDLGDIVPFKLQFPAQPFNVTVFTGENEIGLTIIPPTGPSETYWASDGGLTGSDPIVPGVISGELNRSVVLDQEGLWEFRVLRRAGGEPYEILRRGWIRTLPNLEPANRRVIRL